MTLFRLTLCAWISFSTALTASAGAPENYFQEGWSQSGSALAAVTLPSSARPAFPQKLPIDVLHNPFAHMFITLKAYELYASRFGGGELARYIGGYDDNGPGSDKNDTIVEGAYDEDKPFKNPFNEVSSVLRHFWDYRGGFDRGLAGYDSSVNRAYKYWTGGYGFDGAYDKQWSENDGRSPGKRGEGSISLYRRGEKARAFWYLGHVAHLLEDITVPAHAHLWPHPAPGSDSYESFIHARHKEWSSLPTDSLETFPNLYDLFLRTAQVSKGFDAGFREGEYRGRDGENDRGRRRAEGFSEKELKEEADVLLPLSIMRTAALFVLFYKSVDSAPPSVSLSISEGPQAPHLILSAYAQDSQSGVDQRGYRFEYSSFDGYSWSNWSPAATSSNWPAAQFLPAQGRSYAFRALAADAAGNIGVSEAVGFPNVAKTP